MWWAVVISKKEGDTCGMRKAEILTAESRNSENNGVHRRGAAMTPPGPETKASGRVRKTFATKFDRWYTLCEIGDCRGPGAEKKS
jgi:hypothetical protein